jgi:hypothetical protein
MVPGLQQVLSACQLLTVSKMTSVTVSIASSARDAELIALAREAAEESGVDIDYQRAGSMLVLRLTRGSAQ